MWWGWPVQSRLFTTRGRVPAVLRRNEPDLLEFFHEHFHCKVRDRPARLVSRRRFRQDAGPSVHRAGPPSARQAKAGLHPGDYLVVINAEKIAVTGNKLQDKLYHRFTGYIGNLKTETLAQALERHPERVIETAVKGMLPKGPLGRAMYRKLKVYSGSEHPHAAQQPQVLDI